MRFCVTIPQCRLRRDSEQPDDEPFFPVNNTKSRTNKRNKKKKKRSCTKETGSFFCYPHHSYWNAILFWDEPSVAVCDPHTLLLKIKIKKTQQTYTRTAL